MLKIKKNSLNVHIWFFSVVCLSVESMFSQIDDRIIDMPVTQFEGAGVSWPILDYIDLLKKTSSVLSYSKIVKFSSYGYMFVFISKCKFIAK